MTAPIAVPPFDAASYVASLAGARARLAEAELEGREHARARRRLVFVSCGASDRLSAIAHYWAERHVRRVDLRRYVPAEAMTQAPPVFDRDAVVVLASKSGTTAETVAAARWLRDRPCATVAVTERPDSPLAAACGDALTFGVTDQAYYATWMVTQAFVLGFLDESEAWPLAGPVRAALAALPEALADTIAASEAVNEALAHRLAGDRPLYITAAGPCFSTAYVFAVCILMEMQWLPAHPLEAAEFFHGPFEAIDAKVPVLALVGEDPSRPLAERVVRFMASIGGDCAVRDSRGYALPGIPAEARAVVSPLILQCSLTRLALRIAALRGHPLSTRRYMGVRDY